MQSTTYCLRTARYDHLSVEALPRTDTTTRTCKLSKLVAVVLTPSYGSNDACMVPPLNVYVCTLETCTLRLVFVAMIVADDDHTP